MRAARRASIEHHADEVMAWGRVGVGAKSRDTPHPVPVAGLRNEPISQLSIGSKCALALTDDGRVFVSGYLVDTAADAKDGDDGSLWWPLRHFSDVQLKVAQVACGVFFNIFLTENGEVFTCGQGKSGALGHGDTASRGTPTRVADLIEERVAEVAAGSRHAAALTYDGDLYMWGAGRHGRLGLGDEHDRHAPKLLDEWDLEDRTPGHVVCGYLHTTVLTDDGTLLTFGHGERGQLGHCNFDNSLVPKAVEHLDRERIVQVACGAWHTLALTESGDVFAWGCGRHGQLACEMDDRTTDSNQPQLVAALTEVRISHVGAGGAFSLAVTDDGHVYTWGCANHGQLARESAMIDSVPTKVRGLDPVETLCVGPLSAITLCIRPSQQRDLSAKDTEDVDSDHAHDEAAAAMAVNPLRAPPLAANIAEETEIQMILFPEHFTTSVVTTAQVSAIGPPSSSKPDNVNGNITGGAS